MSYKLVSEVRYNWFYSNEAGEEYQGFTSDGSVVKEILYHTPDEYDKEHYCDVVFTDGEIQRVFNINYVKFV